MVPTRSLGRWLSGLKGEVGWREKPDPSVAEPPCWKRNRRIPVKRRSDELDRWRKGKRKSYIACPALPDVHVQRLVEAGTRRRRPGRKKADLERRVMPSMQWDASGTPDQGIGSPIAAIVVADDAVFTARRVFEARLTRVVCAAARIRVPWYYESAAEALSVCMHYVC